MSRTARRWVVAALAALLAAWVAAPAAVPIYDGLSNPDEPYRWVDPPATAKTTKAPTAAKITVPVRGGQTAAQYANSAEQGPQVSVYVPQGALKAPAGTTSVTVTATPLAPSPPLPEDGTIVSNVYRVTATANGQSVPVIGTGNSVPTLQMRAPDAKPPLPVFEHRTTSGWERVRTIRVGIDVFQASAPTFGDWALVRLSHQPTKSSSSGINVGFLAGGIAVLVVAIVILLIRLRRTGDSAS